MYKDRRSSHHSTFCPDSVYSCVVRLLNWRAEWIRPPASTETDGRQHEVSRAELCGVRPAAPHIRYQDGTRALKAPLSTQTTGEFLMAPRHMKY